MNVVLPLKLKGKLLYCRTERPTNMDFCEEPQHDIINLEKSN